MLLKELIVR